MIKRVLLLLTLSVLIPLAALAGNTALKGKFTRVAGQDFRFDGKTVEVVEFMSFYCDHCYEFEKSIPAIKGNFPKKVNLKIMPIHWGQGSPKPAEAYFLAVDAGKGEAMKKAIFRAHFMEKRDIGSLQVLDSIAAEIDMGFDFGRKLRSGVKSNEVDRALRLAQVYGIEETPTLVIAGNVATTPHATDHDMAAFKENVITIIRSILKG
ncbi:MAG TPA: DsbA family protein [Thermodesulfobacteriota bacterium]